MAKKSQKKSKIVPGVLLICPLTGSILFGSRIRPHSLPVQVCKNGSWYSHCPVHSVRWFVSDETIIQELQGEVYVAEEER